jgi:hypothetical protein
MSRSKKTKPKAYLPDSSRISGFSSPLSLALVEATPGAKDPVDAITKRVREFVRYSGIREPPFPPAEFARLRKVTSIEYRNMAEDGRLIASEAGFKMELRTDRPFQRTNFTCAHEVGHTFFYEAVPKMKYERMTDVIRDNEEETLCNVAASELLMPLWSIKSVTRDYQPSPKSLIEISRIYDTSLTATAIRVLALKLWKAKFILWQCEGETPRALWFAQPFSGLAYYPKLEIENSHSSGIHTAANSGGPVESEEWLCINNRFTYCTITSFRLENSAKVLSCIAPFQKPRNIQTNASQLSMCIQYSCECNGTGSRILYRNGYSYSEPCRAKSHHS